MADAGLPVSGADNAGAALAGTIVIVAVPYDGHEELLKSLSAELAGKIVVDCVNPLGFDKQGAYQLDVPEGSAAQQAAAGVAREPGRCGFSSRQCGRARR